MRLILFFLFLYIQSFCSIFSQKAIDTLETSLGTLVIFENRTWAILNESSFKGVLNERIHKLMSQNSPPVSQTWNNEVCFSSRNNDLSKLTDTIWLCLNEEEISDFKVPTMGVVTSHYGYRSGRYHNGIDLALKIGDTISAAFSGKVRYAKYNDGCFGNLVIIRHYNGLETFYAHLSKHLVVPNQDVKSGDPIGLGGNTGRSFGPHLHFEVRFYDAAINPEEIIDFSSKKLKKENLFVHKGLFLPGAKPSEYYEINHPNESNEIDLAAEKPVTPVAKVSAAKKKYYTIKSGDTLSKIAARNKTTVSALCKLNGLKPSSKIQIGKSIRIK